MNWAPQLLWLIPVLPLVAAGLSALAPQRCRKFAASLAIGSMLIALVLSLGAFVHVVQRAGEGGAVRESLNYRWFELGDDYVRLGWVLDPLTAIMLVMVCFVGLMIFIYSLGYMAHDENFTRFFCFLSLFAAAMLGLIIANSLLLLFICWELVGLTSYLLIGFWYHKPSAAAAAKKAFITTRIGDLAFLLGIVWLYSQSHTLLFYDNGKGCLEASALGGLVQAVRGGVAVSTGIALLLFCGAVGKSGQVPLHVWLPDAMEGPTPVSALIHAATMVAAGVFLVARVYPILTPTGAEVTTALTVVTWVGAITAVFAATIAVAQNDIKRILAYSTVSQLGFMMMGLGAGGVAVGMFHLITHAFFKALLFMGAGSVIHGCHEEQDIRRMGGLKKFMPATFATYAVGMLALSGFPLLFSGFWSKDEILHAAHAWNPSKGPFYLGLFGALLTAFYMTRQVCYVFLGSYRGTESAHGHSGPHGTAVPHESPLVMTGPLMALAIFAVVLGFVGTPAWPWFQELLDGGHASWHTERLFEPGVLILMVASSVVVFAGIGLGFWLYGRKPIADAGAADVLERSRPDIYALLKNKWFVDELYEATVIRFTKWLSVSCAWLDDALWSGMVQVISWLVQGLAWLDWAFDQYVVNLGFDEGCDTVNKGGRLLSRLQNGRVQSYLRVIGVALCVLVLILIWGWHAS